MVLILKLLLVRKDRSKFTGSGFKIGLNCLPLRKFEKGIEGLFKLILSVFLRSPTVYLTDFVDLFPLFAQ